MKKMKKGEEASRGKSQIWKRRKTDIPEEADLVNTKESE